MPQSAIIPQSRSAVIITVEGLDQHWETFSGITDESSSSDEYSDGLSNRLYKISGPRSLAQMDISKAFDRVVDKPIIQYWKNWTGGREAITTMTVGLVSEYNPDPVIAEAFIFYGVRPLKIETAEADKKSNDVMRLMLSFIADDWTYA